MGGSIIRKLFVLAVLEVPFLGQAQSVFNKAFDEDGTTNSTPNAMEIGDYYYFVQKKIIETIRCFWRL